MIMVLQNLESGAFPHRVDEISGPPYIAQTFFCHVSIMSPGMSCFYPTEYISRNRFLVLKPAMQQKDQEINNQENRVQIFMPPCTNSVKGDVTDLAESWFIYL